MNLGVNTQFDFLAALSRIIGKFDPNEVIEEHPLMRMELSNLHQGNHLDQFQCSPVLVELVLDG